MAHGCGRVAEDLGPPGVVPRGGGGSEDEDLRFLQVELQAAVSHPGCDVLHSFLEVVPGGVGFLGEVEDELGVVGVGYYAESVFSDDGYEGGHVDVEERGAEG